MFGIVSKSLLDIEKQKNIDLSNELSESKEENASLKKELNSEKTRFLELTRSQNFRLINDINELENKAKYLKNMFASEEANLTKIRTDGLAKINAEFQAKRIEVDKELKDRNILLEKRENRLSSLIKEIQASKNELSMIKISIEIQDELDTVSIDIDELSKIKSSDTKEFLLANKRKQRYFIKSGDAWRAYSSFHWNNSFTAGKAKQKRLGKFLLAAFNAECDSVVSSSKKNNFHSNHRKIEKYFKIVNKLGEEWSVVIERPYLKLRLEELRYHVEYYILKDLEREEERYINDSIREEKRVQKEIENFVKKRESEEKALMHDIENVTKALRASSESEITKLKRKIEELQSSLKRASSEKERALSLAQLTRSGHVYVISNPGSFGPGVFKIGMTRRLDPKDRVKELGDASVPFYFDTHAIIHSEDAPGLEKELHKRFDNHRVNKDNYRREFFKVSLREIESVVREIHGEVIFD